MEAASAVSSSVVGSVTVVVAVEAVVVSETDAVTVVTGAS